MKQYWRVGTIRAMVGLLLGMLVLGRYYYRFIPFFDSFEPSILGAIVLAGVLFLVFLGAGYLYDEKIQLWNEQIQIVTEKNPYQYVPKPRLYQIEYPLYYALIDTIKQIFTKRGLDTQQIDELSQYLKYYFDRRPNRRSDLFTAEGIAETFMQKHPFVEDDVVKSTPGIRSRIKKGFQLRVWRLTWVQSFTGLAQDVLVFASLYIVVLFPDEVTSTGGVSLELLFLGILFISLPLYVGLIISGYYYDKKLRIWSPDNVVKIERNPFSYVPTPRIISFTLPIINFLLTFYYDMFIKLGLDTAELERLIEYLEKYMNLTPGKLSDYDFAKKMRSDFGPLFCSYGDD